MARLTLIGIGAHPDDIEIYCAGFLSIAQACGHRVHWLIATDGGGAGKGDQATLCQRRREEARAAAAVFNVAPVFLGHPDGALAEERGVVANIEGTLEPLKPDLIVTHAPNDYHPDHRALSEYVSRAASFRAPVLYADTMLGINCQPDYYIDITKHFERKLQALKLHASQPIERFMERLEVWNRFRGLQSNLPGCKYAEGFSFEKRYPFGEIRGLLAAMTAARYWS